MSGFAKRCEAIIRATVLLSILVCDLPSPVAAQVPAKVAAGDRIRVWKKDGSRQTGRVSAVAPDIIELQPGGAAAPLSIPLTTVTRIEISRGTVGKRQAAWRGAKWGTLLLAIPGAVSLGFQHKQVGEHGSSIPEAAAVGALSGGLFGALIGAAIGAAGDREKWERVWP